MRKSVVLISIIILGGILLSVYDLNGIALNAVYNTNGESLNAAYDVNGYNIFTSIPVPTGDLNASETIVLPDIHAGVHGWTCTGMCYDPKTDSFLIGDNGETFPGTGDWNTQIVRVTNDFETVIETIPLYNENSVRIEGVQGVTIDTSDGTIWYYSPRENKVRNIDTAGNIIKSFALSRGSGIAYSRKDNSFWMLVNNPKKILKVSKTGTIIEEYAFEYNEALDQCFIDEGRNLLYMTAGANYTGRNNVYCFNTTTHEQYIACTVDSYAVEGIWLGDTNKMIILNDGYYHSAAVPHNQANIYTIE